MPPMVTVVPPSSNRTATSLFFVSVVIMAMDAPVPLSRLPSSKGAMALTPAVILSMGSCMPMTPVDATRTLSAEIPRARAAASAVCPQYPMPSSPVQALAMPAFITTARAGAPLVTWFLSHFTGAAFTILVVKVPADRQGSWL